MAVSNERLVFGDRRGQSPEERMRAFHAERVAGSAEISFADRRIDQDTNDSEEDRSLKAARAEAVEFVVRAFAAVDRNVALSEKARVRQEEHKAAAENLRLEAEKELGRARELREQAERELDEARSAADRALASARAESARIVERANGRSRAEAEAARQRLVESLGPLRDVIGRASGTIDAFVNAPAPALPLDETAHGGDDATIDIRQAGADGSGAKLVALPSLSN